jgi:antitoxin (DNA-binding transcriptional repressor) of toxin-antitoxin stability system
MKKAKISVTEASRNFADCVNRVHYQGFSFVLLKNGKAVAHLAPVEEKICLGRDAAKALAEVKLTTAEAKAWRRDLQKARKHLKAPTDKWR